MSDDETPLFTDPEDGPRSDRRPWIVAAGVVLGLVAVALVVWAVARGRGPALEVVEKKPPEIEHARPTTPTPSTLPSQAVVPTSSVVASETTAPASSQPTATPQPAPSGATDRQAPYVVFRRDEAIWLAREDGSGAVTVTTATVGAFALSPDARTLAYVDTSTKLLMLLDLTSMKATKVGPVLQNTPAWSADSAWLLVVTQAAHGGEVVARVRRAAPKLEIVSPGVRGAISADGRVVAVVADPDRRSRDVQLFRDNKLWKTLTVPAQSVDVALGGNTAYVATSRTTTQTADEGVWAVTFEGSSRRIAADVDVGKPLDYSMLSVSPDGKHLVYARSGDDGYSRTFALPVAGGTAVAISPRKDTYPSGWTADSSAVFAIEGNSWQGQGTALVRVGTDGRGRIVVSAGADR